MAQGRGWPWAGYLPLLSMYYTFETCKKIDFLKPEHETRSLKRNKLFHKFTWILFQYQDEIVKKERLKNSHTENGHNRYSSHKWCTNRKRPRGTLKENMDERVKKLINSKSWVGSFVYLLNIRPVHKVLLQTKTEQFRLLKFRISR